MPAYSFEALDTQGQTRKGVMEADSVKSARGLLRAQALVPLAVQSVGAGQAATDAEGRRGLHIAFFSKRVFNATGLAIWT